MQCVLCIYMYIVVKPITSGGALRQPSQGYSQFLGELLAIMNKIVMYLA